MSIFYRRESSFRSPSYIRYDIFVRICRTWDQRNDLLSACCRWRYSPTAKCRIDYWIPSPRESDREPCRSLRRWRAWTSSIYSVSSLRWCWSLLLNLWPALPPRRRLRSDGCSGSCSCWGEPHYTSLGYRTIPVHWPQAEYCHPHSYRGREVLST